METFDVVELEGRKFLRRQVTEEVTKTEYFLYETLLTQKTQKEEEVAETDRLIAEAIRLMVDREGDR